MALPGSTEPMQQVQEDLEGIQSRGRVGNRVGLGVIHEDLDGIKKVLEKNARGEDPRPGRTPLSNVIPMRPDAGQPVAQTNQADAAPLTRIGSVVKNKATGSSRNASTVRQASNVLLFNRLDTQTRAKQEAQTTQTTQPTQATAASPQVKPLSEVGKVTTLNIKAVEKLNIAAKNVTLEGEDTESVTDKDQEPGWLSKFADSAEKLTVGAVTIAASADLLKNGLARPTTQKDDWDKAAAQNQRVNKPQEAAGIIRKPGVNPYVESLSIVPPRPAATAPAATVKPADTATSSMDIINQMTNSGTAMNKPSAAPFGTRLGTSAQSSVKISRPAATGQSINTNRRAPRVTSEAAEAMDFFQKKNWTKIQAAGLVGGFMNESGGKLNPRAVGDSGQSFGVAQWSKTRQKDFEAWAGKPMAKSTRKEQLEFANFELTQGKEKSKGDMLKKATTLEQATVAASKFERFKGHERNLQSPETQSRLANARALAMSGRENIKKMTTENDTLKSAGQKPLIIPMPAPAPAPAAAGGNNTMMLPQGKLRPDETAFLRYLDGKSRY